MEEKKVFKLWGMNWYITAFFIVVVLSTMATGALTTDLAGTIALMMAISIITVEIGDRIPIWNDYIGGGIVLTFLVAATLSTYGLMPEKYIKAINDFNGKQDFLTLYIIFLITGSVLALDRKLLLKSFAGYIPAILGGLALAAVMGVIGGFIFGIGPVDIVVKYVLPIMGGGNGAGAVPLSQIYEAMTGQKAATYYSFAVVILTIANIVAIISAGLLNKLGEKKPSLTGDRTNLMRSAPNFASEDTKVEVTMKDLGAAFFVVAGFFTLGRLVAKSLLPTICGFEIHQFAYMIIFVAIAAMLGIIPDNVRHATKRLQSFFSGNLTGVLMVGVGMEIDIKELIAALSVPNVVIAVFIVVGAILGSAIVGYIVGFYPIDSAVTAGLCMANRGGSGDLAVLGASKRMPLIAYAQLSSRLGGGIVLVIASIFFGMFLK